MQDNQGPQQPPHVRPMPTPFSTHYETEEGQMTKANGDVTDVVLVHATLYLTTGAVHVWANADEAEDIAKAWHDVAVKARASVPGLQLAPSLESIGLVPPNGHK